MQLVVAMDLIHILVFKTDVNNTGNTGDKILAGRALPDHRTSFSLIFAN